MSTARRVAMILVVFATMVGVGAWWAFGEAGARDSVIDIHERSDDVAESAKTPRRNPAAEVGAPASHAPDHVRVEIDSGDEHEEFRPPEVENGLSGGLPTVCVKLLSRDGTSPIVGATVALFRVARGREGLAVDRAGTNALTFAMTWQRKLRSGLSRELQTDQNGEALWNDVEPGAYRWVAVAGFQGKMEPTFEGRRRRLPLPTTSGEMTTRKPDRICSGLFVVEDGDRLRFESRSLATARVRGRVASFAGLKARVDLAFEEEHRPGLETFEVESSWTEKDEAEFEFDLAGEGRMVVRARWFEVDANRLSYAMTEIFEVKADDVVDVGELVPPYGVPVFVRLALDGSGLEEAQLNGRRCELRSVALVPDTIAFDPLRELEIVGAPEGVLSFYLSGLPKSLFNAHGEAVQLEKRSLRGDYPEQTIFEFRFKGAPDFGDLALRIRNAQPGDDYGVRLFHAEKRRRANTATGRLDDERTLVMKRLPPGRYVALVRSVRAEPARSCLIPIHHEGAGRTEVAFDASIALKVKGYVPQGFGGQVVGLGIESRPGFDRPMPIFLERVDSDGTFELSTHPATERRLVFFDRKAKSERVVAIREVNGEYVLDLR